MRTTTITRTKTIAWARARDAELQAKGDAVMRIGSSLTNAYGAGQPVCREDLLIALVRMMALTADAMSLSRQVVAACDAAVPAQGE